MTGERISERQDPGAKGRRVAPGRRWLRFALGVSILAGFFWFLTTRPTPPGVAGQIIERNLRQDVDATALFFTELERMPAIEERFR